MQSNWAKAPLLERHRDALVAFIAALNANEHAALETLAADEFQQRLSRVLRTLGLALLLIAALGVLLHMQGYLDAILKIDPVLTFTALGLLVFLMVLGHHCWHEGHDDPFAGWRTPLAETDLCSAFEDLVFLNPSLPLLPQGPNARQLYVADFLLARYQVEAAQKTQERAACARLHSQAFSDSQPAR